MEIGERPRDIETSDSVREGGSNGPRDKAGMDLFSQYFVEKIFRPCCVVVKAA